MKDFPWDWAVAFGLGVLKRSPREFWGMTPRELAAAAEGLGGRRTTPPARAEFEALMEAYPDERT